MLGLNPHARSYRPGGVAAVAIGDLIRQVSATTARKQDMSAPPSATLSDLPLEVQALDFVSAPVELPQC
jgi:hypothetical protein